MKTRISMDTVQGSEVGNGYYLKDHMISVLQNMSNHDFQKFCREVAHLNHHYDTTVGAIASDQKEIAEVYPELTWTIEEIDFDSLVIFKKIS